MQPKELKSVIYLRIDARIISKSPHIEADRLGSMYVKYKSYVDCGFVRYKVKEHASYYVECLPRKQQKEITFRSILKLFIFDLNARLQLGPESLRHFYIFIDASHV